MSLEEKDKQYIWHPYTQHGLLPKHIPIVKSENCYLFDENGKKYIDAISSWWVNIHGHAHPYIANKIHEQLLTLEHVIFGGFTHPKAVELAERILKKLANNQQKVFFSDNGSTAVEVALKMAIQFFRNLNHRTNIQIIAIEGSFHGDTFGAMSVSARNQFNIQFDEYLLPVRYIPFPTVNNINEVCWLLNEYSKDKNAIFIYEPLIQGAAGMRMYEPSLLHKILEVCETNHVIKIADEVMTGFGRTGKFFASDYSTIQPDIVCMSKGLTGGTLPMGLTSCTQKIYDEFYSDDSSKTFYHGHSFTGNPIGCAAACASLDLLEKEETWTAIKRIENQHKQFAEVLTNYHNVRNIKTFGTILSFELNTSEKTSYNNSIRNQAYKFFIERGVLLRPLGNVIYILPPYSIEEKDLKIIYDTILSFLNQFQIKD
jgi:adenosylmethionine---8-amino-7-oxononanoate aminotransferase